MLSFAKALPSGWPGRPMSIPIRLSLTIHCHPHWTAPRTEPFSPYYPTSALLYQLSLGERETVWVLLKWSIWLDWLEGSAILDGGRKTSLIYNYDDVSVLTLNFNTSKSYYEPNSVPRWEQRRYIYIYAMQRANTVVPSDTDTDTDMYIWRW